MRTTSRTLAALASAAIYIFPAAAQTYTSCDPLSQSCPADPALGTSKSYDFTSGSSSDWTATGNPTYDSNGVGFTIAQSGDSPMLTSNWYIMFGKVEIVLKAAPGVGIVSSAVLQSDDLDEIDWEWLGADDTQVQSNYFGKGQTTTYNRGAFHSDPGNQDGFKTYTVDWTSSQIAWQIDGMTVRTLTPDESSNQYPQTPMQVKIGAWSGGDPSNAQGTIEWAGGETDYSQGPFTMYVQSISVTDYSTGTEYKYGDQSGSWQSIVAVGGSVNSGGSSTESSAPAITSSSSGGPIPFSGDGTSSYAHPSVYPWVPESTTLSTATATYSLPGLPSGWTVSSSGKAIPPSSAPSTSHHVPSISSPTASQPQPSQAGYEVVTKYNSQGFTTVVTQPAGWSTMSKSYDDRGFLITAGAPAPSSTKLVVNAKAAHAGEDSTSSIASDAVQTSATAAASTSASPVPTNGSVRSIIASSLVVCWALASSLWLL